MSNAAASDDDRPYVPPLSEEAVRDRLQELLERHSTQLSEHFSSVQIIGTWLTPDGGTFRFRAGSGDLYARIGAVKTWLKQIIGELLE